MAVDLRSATAFMATHARLLDRRRLAHVLGIGSADSALAALEPYRNDDGGYGSGLEPDLRSMSSQPGGALHALEVFSEIAPTTTPRSVELCNWLDDVSLPDGGMPFALPISDPEGCAPFWVDADHTTSSLHITAAIATLALRVAAHDPAVAEHPWLRGATDFCLDRIRSGPPPVHALELKFALQFLDAAIDTRPDARDDLARLGAAIPPNGRLHVAGGLDSEFMNALDFAPTPDRPIRALFSTPTVDEELQRLEAEQRDDGGWPADWTSYSPLATLEWRGWLTVRAVTILLANARV